MRITHKHPPPPRRSRVAGAFVRCSDSRTRVGVDGGRQLTRAATHVLRHDAAEIPEARLAAVALLAAHARLAGALAGGGVTRALVRAVDVALAGTWGGGAERVQHVARSANRLMDVQIC